MNKTATKLVRNKLHFNDNLDKTTKYISNDNHF